MAGLTRLTPAILEKCVHSSKNQVLEICRRLHYSASGNNGDNEGNSKRPVIYEKEILDAIDDIEEPTNCCMSGCANCVWIQYAERLSEKLADSDADIQKIIIDKVQDPNMKAFLSMELRWRKLC